MCTTKKEKGITLQEKVVSAHLLGIRMGKKDGNYTI